MIDLEFKYKQIYTGTSLRPSGSGKKLLDQKILGHKKTGFGRANRNMIDFKLTYKQIYTGSIKI